MKQVELNIVADNKCQGRNFHDWFHWGKGFSPQQLVNKLAHECTEVAFSAMRNGIYERAYSRFTQQ